LGLRHRRLDALLNHVFADGFRVSRDWRLRLALNLLFDWPWHNYPPIAKAQQLQRQLLWQASRQLWSWLVRDVGMNHMKAARIFHSIFLTAASLGLARSSAGADAASKVPAMEPRICVFTLGVADLNRSFRFYKEGLGFPTKMAPDVLPLISEGS